MIGTIPFAGIQSTGQSTGQAITTTAAQLVITGGVATPMTQNRVGDPAVKADPTNNRIIVNTPGIYEIEFDLTATASGTQTAAFTVRKNGASGSVISGPKVTGNFGTSPLSVGMKRIIEVTAADIPTTGGLSTFADPDATAGAGKPAGGFAGAGAAPKTGVPIDILVTGGGSVTLTVTDLGFIVKRIG